MVLRSPICTVVGHVDHGKSSILDRIRGTAVVKGEAGAITQAIGASIIPLETIKKICGTLLDQLKMDLKIPGLLFIDTPGHAAFTNLRKRGGNLADIAILVIDIKEGMMPQTLESIEILRSYKTPFIIAANKIDLLTEWKQSDAPLLQNINQQSEQTVKEIETKLYEIVGKLSELGLESERFDRVSDYTKQIAIIPTSAETGEGIPELLMVLTGLAEKYLEECLYCDTDGPAKGIVLEVKEERGIGKSVDAILHDGCLKVNDTIVFGGLHEPVVTRAKALFEPTPLSEMRDKKSHFTSVKAVCAATGVKIAASDVDSVIAGMPIMVASDETLEEIKKEVQKDVQEVVIETDKTGIVVKADSLGSLEALLTLLKEDNIQIKRATIGNITKKDIADAQSNKGSDPFAAVVLGFNVDNISGIDKVKVITSKIIYDIIDQFKTWVKDEKKKQESSELGSLIPPCKFEIMKGYVFRQSNPAVLGVEVLAGTVTASTPIMNPKGKRLGAIRGMQADKKSIEKAEKGKQVAVSLPGLTMGRQINEGDILYADLPEEDFRKFKALKQFLSEDQKMILKEIAEIKRTENVVWGI